MLLVILLVIFDLKCFKLNLFQIVTFTNSQNVEIILKLYILFHCLLVKRLKLRLKSLVRIHRLNAVLLILVTYIFLQLKDDNFNINVNV